MKSLDSYMDARSVETRLDSGAGAVLTAIRLSIRASPIFQL